MLALIKFALFTAILLSIYIVVRKVYPYLGHGGAVGAVALVAIGLIGLQ